MAKNKCFKLFNKLLFKPVSDFLYPPFCLHCDRKIASSKIFCSDCARFFELIDPAFRCRRCFKEIEREGICIKCRYKKDPALRLGAALEYSTQVASFLRAWKDPNQAHLNKTAANFLILQFFRLNWPIPDLIVPMPKRKLCEKNPLIEVAGMLGQSLQCKVGSIAKRQLGDLPRMRLSSEQKERFANPQFYLKQKRPIKNKIILLVDDLYATGQTMENLAASFLFWAGV